ncbi:MAG: phosphoenolpyruvate--protein phosphotransferase [Nitrospinae bacterium]|nr:phosphoenolpyruvate--protein phosphotransferase [Nitrospinota bacterium]
MASVGIAIGKAYVLDHFHLGVVGHGIQNGQVKAEVDRFTAAVEAARKLMVEAANSNVKHLSNNLRDILNPHIQILDDPILIGQTIQVIEKELVNAEWALKQTYDKLAQRFEKIRDPYIKERAHDIEMVVNKVLRALLGKGEESLSGITEPVIVIAHDLTPFDTAQMSAKHVLGFVTEVGGKTSHTGIIASSLSIPAVVGVPKIAKAVNTGDHVILDAISGLVIVNPTDQQFRTYNRRRQQFLYIDRKLEREAVKEARTKDGVLVRLKANIESTQDIDVALTHGAEGIGLYRTEFLFVRGNQLPGEEEQFEDYKKVLKAIAPHDAVIRTLDLGGDKVPAYHDEEPEANPALGLRAIRYCLNYPAVFRTQLKAILRASHYGKMKVMYPMVSSIEELRRAKSIMEKIKREMDKEKIPYDPDLKVGMMIETPSAAMMARQFAPYVDFFSIGTNDLIQYLLAIDRGNQKVAHLYQPLHPAVIRLLWSVIQAANIQKVPVSVCGKMSADPYYAYLLLGMGEVADLSMDSHSIPKVKQFIRNVSVEEARQHVLKIMEFDLVRDIKKFLIKNVSPMMSEGMFSELTVEEPGVDL